MKTLLEGAVEVKIVPLRQRFQEKASGAVVSDESRIIGYVPMEYDKRGFPLGFACGYGFWQIQENDDFIKSTESEARKMYEEWAK